MKRILVIGSCGAGKSTFARSLGDITGLPVVHLDRLYWKPNWVETGKAEWKAKVAEVLKGDTWIIDGNYGGTMEMRIAACDTVFFLDYSRYLCVWRVIKRALKNRGRTRLDMGEDCVEKIDWEFVKWTWDYPNRSRTNVLGRLAAAADRVKIYTLRSCKAADALLQDFNKNQQTIK